MIELNDKNFDEAVNLSKKCLVYFWAEWCVPCKRFSPILSDVQKEYGIQIFKVNADENPVKSSEFSVSSIPTVVLFEDGVEIKKVIGAMPKHLIVKELSQWI
jgi:thioredoxin 1